MNWVSTAGGVVEGLRLMGEQVRVVRLQKAYDKTQLKLFFCVETGSKSWEIFRLVRGALMAAGARKLQGTAPPSE